MTKILPIVVCAVFCHSSFAEVKVSRDIQYYPAESLASADEYQKTRCRLDIKWPDGQKGFPVLVWFHGGGLVNGGKHFAHIRDTGIAQAGVNYRLLSATNSVRKITGRDCVEDAAAAVAWTLRNIASYGGDPKKVYVAGCSAGGYLTMMVGMAPEYLAKWGFKPLDLAGLAPVTGQATKHFNIRKYSGDTSPQFQPVIDELAPLYHCRNWKGVPPIICVCGQVPWEWKCRAEENRLLISSLAALGHKSAWYVELPFCDHGRCGFIGDGYVEMFIKGRIPADSRLR